MWKIIFFVMAIEGNQEGFVVNKFSYYSQIECLQALYTMPVDYEGFNVKGGCVFVDFGLPS